MNFGFGPAATIVIISTISASTPAVSECVRELNWLVVQNSCDRCIKVEVESENCFGTKYSKVDLRANETKKLRVAFPQPPSAQFQCNSASFKLVGEEPCVRAGRAISGSN
ncbi:hypothetical protein SAMN04488002_0197 [Litoreibacter janthinus]|uniref:Uncharacterized protein n=1 Tax=Litoreibacter janthinus TaxID=670154 RepID=A0A1I6FS27_9RHOB|nr:hypothetical protein SAMN04488002_0197 [Litoreibacter janthinus]